MSDQAKPKTRLYLTYVLVVSIGLFIANTFFDLFTHSKNTALNLKDKKQITKKPGVKPAPKPSVKTPPKLSLAPAAKPATPIPGAPKKAPEGSIVLNGIFFSEDRGYALINNKIVKEGDSVEGAVVKNISVNAVELEKEGKIVKLTNR